MFFFFTSQCEGEKYNQLCLAEGHILYILIYEHMYLIANCFLKKGILKYHNKEWRLYFQYMFVASALVPEPEITHNKMFKNN